MFGSLRISCRIFCTGACPSSNCVPFTCQPLSHDFQHFRVLIELVHIFGCAFLHEAPSQPHRVFLLSPWLRSLEQTRGCSYWHSSLVWTRPPPVLSGLFPDIPNLHLPLRKCEQIRLFSLVFTPVSLDFFPWYPLLSKGITKAF